MQQIIDSIKNLYKEWKGVEPDSIDVLQQSGSERRYFRLHEKDKQLSVHTAQMCPRMMRLFISPGNSNLKTLLSLKFLQ